jgi:hypothetical protein
MVIVRVRTHLLWRKSVRRGTCESTNGTDCAEGETHRKGKKGEKRATDFADDADEMEGRELRISRMTRMR